MTTAPPFWNVRITCSCDQISLIEEAFADESCAFSALQGTNPQEQIAEILFQSPPDPQALHARLALLDSLSQGGDRPLSFEIIPLGALDWVTKVAGDLAPLPIGPWTVYGAAFADQKRTTPFGLQMEATSAFGTGEHPTTHGCLLMLDHYLKRHPQAQSWRMLDVGCGSGILAMAFATATSNGYALGIDMEENAITIAQNNLLVNDLGDRVRFEVGTGYQNPLVGAGAPYDLIMANIFAGPLRDMAKDLKRHLKPNGIAILSGFLNEQANGVISAHRQQGLTVVKRMRMDAWSVLALRGPMRAS